MLDTFRRKLAGLIAPTSRSLDPGSGLGWSPSPNGPTAPVARHDRQGLTIPAIWQAVNTYVNTVGSLELYVAERDDRGGRRAARDHWAFDLLNRRPNRRSTSMRLRQAWVGHAMTLGNGYLEIEWDARGREAKALHLLDPRDIRPVEVQGSIVYEQVRGGPSIPAEDMLHLAMFGWDGVKGYSPIEYGQQTVDVAVSQRDYQAGLFNNSAQAGGHVEFPGRMNTVQKQEFRTFWNQTHQGTDNAGNLGILDNGAKWVQTTFSPQDAELILGCRFTVEEVARIWNLPPWKLGLPNQSGKSGEELTIDFYTQSILPVLTAAEQEFDNKLLGRMERESFFVFHDVKTLLRVNTAAETAQEQADLASGVRTINEVRSARGLEPSGEPYADQLMIPTNNLTALKDIGKGDPTLSTQPAVSTPKPPDPADGPVPPPKPEAVAAVRDVLADALGRMVRVECEAARRASKRDRMDLWAEDFYPKHSKKVADAIAPAIRASVALTGFPHDPKTVASLMTTTSLERLRDLWTTVPPAEMPEAVEKVCVGWEASRAVERAALLVRETGE